MLFQAPSAGRTTLVLMAWDANLPIIFFAGYGVLKSGHPLSVLQDHPWLFVSVVAFPAVYALAGAYCERTLLCSRGTLLRTVVGALVVTALMGVGILFLDGPAAAREIFTSLTIAMIAGGVGVRALTALKTGNAAPVKTALVVGAAFDGCAVIDCILREPRLRVRVAGFVDDDPLKKNFQHKGVPVIATAQGLEEAAVQKGANLVITAVSGSRSAGLIRSLVRLKASGVDVVEMAPFIERSTGQCPIRQGDGGWFLYNQGFAGNTGSSSPLWKRGADLMAAILGIAASLPLLGLVSLMIKLECRGPVFSRSERIGQGEKPFTLLKFRTNRGGVPAASRAGASYVGGRRTTRIGRWLRRVHLDEVPQLGNVLNGEMSFVGPRADSPLQAEKLKAAIPCYGLKYAIKPGVVGWAQIQKEHPGTTSDVSLEHLKYDLYYLKNMSPLLDQRIVHRALRAVFFARSDG